MCEYLLSREPKDEQFVQFLVNVIFCEEPPLKIPHSYKTTGSTKPSVTVQPNEASIYIPQESNKQPIGVVNVARDGDPKNVIATLKKMADRVNKPDLISVINCLENQLVSSNLENVVRRQDNGIKIRLPFCWNCKTKSCSQHNK